MNYDYIFDSNSMYEKEYAIDWKNDKPTTVFFEKENVVLTADKDGNAVFETADGTKLSATKAEADRYFREIYCRVKDGAILVRFPVIITIDHYPNCDGEYDRYSDRIVDEITVTCAV